MDLEIGGKLPIVYSQPVSIELSRGMKGSYSWTVKIHAATPDAAMQHIQEIDANLRSVYGAGPIPPLE